MAIEKNELVKKAQRDYEYLTGDAATRRLQELREKAILDENSAYETGKIRGIEEGERIGEVRGKAIGEKQGLKRAAMAMIKNNEKRENIIKYTGLSEKELDKLLLQKI